MKFSGRIKCIYFFFTSSQYSFHLGFANELSIFIMDSLEKRFHVFFSIWILGFCSFRFGAWIFLDFNVSSTERLFIGCSQLHMFPYPYATFRHPIQVEPQKKIYKFSVVVFLSLLGCFYIILVALIRISLLALFFMFFFSIIFCFFFSFSFCPS